MSPDRNNLSDEQRRLLGDRQADELLADERWLARRLGPPDAPLPEAVRARLAHAVGRELERQKRQARPIRRRLPYGWAVAAALLLGLLTVLASQLFEHGTPREPISKNLPNPSIVAPAVARAEKALDIYVASISPDELQSELNLLDEELPEGTELSENPWDAVIEAIEQPAQPSNPTPGEPGKPS